MVNQACIVGAGNSAHVTAGLVASLPDWQATVYAPRKTRAQEWRDGLEKGGMKVVYPNDEGKIIHGKPVRVSKDAKDVVPGSSVLIFCLPAQAFEDNIRDIAPYVDQGAMIGTICASMGVDWFIDHGMQKVGRAPDSYGIFALQNLPWACRVPAGKYGEEVEVLGAKPWMEIVARPNSRLQEISDTMTKLIYMKCPPLESGFLGVGLSNLCMVIHPAVMHGNFVDWDGKTPYATPPLFYQGLSVSTADNMDMVSNELLEVRKFIEEKYAKADLSIIHHIFPWCMRAYGKYITDDSTLQKRFSSNKAYEGLVCPMNKVEGGYVPNYQARYMSEDVPYNLVAAKGVAKICGIKTPKIDEILEWSQKVLEKEYIVNDELVGKDLQETFAPQKFGYNKLEDIPELEALK